jgi:hypothetical protein
MQYGSGAPAGSFLASTVQSARGIPHDAGRVSASRGELSGAKACSARRWFSAIVVGKGNKIFSGGWADHVRLSVRWTIESIGGHGAVRWRDSAPCRRCAVQTRTAHPYALALCLGPVKSDVIGTKLTDRVTFQEGAHAIVLDGQAPIRAIRPNPITAPLLGVALDLVPQIF